MSEWVTPRWGRRGVSIQERARAFFDQWEGCDPGGSAPTFKAQVQQMLEASIADAAGGGEVVTSARNDEPVYRFTLPSGHRVAIYQPGTLGLPLYRDHELVLLADTGSQESNLRAALAAVGDAAGPSREARS